MIFTSILKKETKCHRKLLSRICWCKEQKTEKLKREQPIWPIKSKGAMYTSCADGPKETPGVPLGALDTGTFLSHLKISGHTQKTEFVITVIES